MKTYHLFATAALLLMAGCSQNEITEISPDANPPVSFDIYTGAQTKGTVTDNADGATGIKNSTGFGILAYYTGQATWSATGFDPDFMWNQQVKYNTTKWEYSPLKYWPVAEYDKISFFAYAPYSTSQASGSETSGIKLPATTATAKPTITFTLQDNPAYMVDLVAGSVKNQEKTSSAVGFTLDHLLSRVEFKAKLSAAIDNQTAVYITGMDILGTADNSSSKFYKTAVYDWSAGTWDYTSSTKQSPAYAVNNIMNLTAPTSAGGYSTSSIKISSTTPVTLFKTNQYLFLIPPTDAADAELATKGGITADTDVKVKVKYDIVTVDNKVSEGHTTTSTSVTVSLPTTTLKRAKAYEYTLTLSLDVVTVSVTTVTGWGTTIEKTL